MACPRIRRVLVAIAISLAALAAVLGGAAYALVHRHLETRGAVATGAAPDFTLPDQRRRDVPLASLVARGPAVLVFYRGYW